MKITPLGNTIEYKNNNIPKKCLTNIYWRSYFKTALSNILKC